MCGARDNREFLHASQVLAGLLVQTHNGIVAFAHDQKRGCGDMAEVLVGQIRAAAARDDCADAVAEDGGCCDGSRRACAGAEKADRLIMCGRMVFDPPHGCDQAVGEHFDVEAELTICGVPSFLLTGEQIQQDSSDSRFMEDGGDELVSPAVATAAAPVGEDHDPRGIRWHDPFGFDVHGIDRYLDDPGKGVHEPAAAVFMMCVEHGVCF